MTVPVPAHIRVFVEALGEDEAERFFLHFGGTEVYWPTAPKARSQVAIVMGRSAALALAEVADRLPGRVPIPKKWLVLRMRAKGLTTVEIARTLHIADASVRRLLVSAREANQNRYEDPRQRRFF